MTESIVIQRKFEQVRTLTEELCKPLEIEDYVVQTCEDVSPTKWHLAHTSWFFETFLLSEYLPEFKSSHAQYAELFNSYYNTIGPQFSRPERGNLSRPTVKEVMNYRSRVTESIRELLENPPVQTVDEIIRRVELGIHHEQQHQELLLTDIKHVFGQNPLLPAYRKIESLPPAPDISSSWEHFEGGLCQIGHDGSEFSFDNECPRHRVFLDAFALNSNLVTQGEFSNFMEDGGYENHQLWLSDGWDRIQSEGWRHPLYWHRSENGPWCVMTLHGVHPLDPNAPVSHVSFFEADAYARWAGHRLPTEFEWEHAAQKCRRSLECAGRLVADNVFHPLGKATPEGQKLRHMLGEVWQWTSSPYVAYPRYKPRPGALGEYNGKFMNGQRVLRGGSCVTSRDDFRISYRNFFQPEKRWQFSGIRLARGVSS